MAGPKNARLVFHIAPRRLVQQAAELASLMGLAAIVTAESLANFSRRWSLKGSDEVYRNWGSEPPRAGVQKRRAGWGFLAGPYFWAGLALGGASTLGAIALTRRIMR